MQMERKTYSIERGQPQNENLAVLSGLISTMKLSLVLWVNFGPQRAMFELNSFRL